MALLSWFSSPSFHLLLHGAPATFIPPITIYLATGRTATTAGSPWDCDRLAVCKTDLEFYRRNYKPCNSKPPVGGSDSFVPRNCSGDSWASEIQLSLLNTIPLTGWGNRSQGNPRKLGRPYYLANSFFLGLVRRREAGALAGTQDWTGFSFNKPSCTCKIKFIRKYWKCFTFFLIPILLFKWFIREVS